jgi:hypothetical protein
VRVDAAARAPACAPSGAAAPTPRTHETCRRAAFCTSALGLSVQIAHSGDGRAFANKASAPEVPLQGIYTSGPTVLTLGYDTGFAPSLAFVRLRFDFSATTPFNLHMRCTLTLNNTRERAFAQQLLETVAAGPGGHCDSWMMPGDPVSIDGTGHWSDDRIAPIIDALPGDEHRNNFTAALRGYFDPPVPPGSPVALNEDQQLTLASEFTICFMSELVWINQPDVTSPVPSFTVLQKNDTDAVAVFASLDDQWWVPLSS